MFLLKTDLIIRRSGWKNLSLKKRIDANIDSCKILHIAITVIGIYSLTQSVPEFIGNLPTLMAKFTLLSLLKVIIGFLLVVKNPEIEPWISSRQSS